MSKKELTNTEMERLYYLTKRIQSKQVKNSVLNKLSLRTIVLVYKILASQPNISLDLLCNIYFDTVVLLQSKKKV